jgi:hypothetical protein
MYLLLMDQRAEVEAGSGKTACDEFSRVEYGMRKESSKLKR